MIHTRAFLNHKDYENFINGGEGKVCKPNVSVCEQEYELHFNFTPTIDKDCVPHTAGTVYSYVITYVYKTSSAETQEKKVTVTGNSKDVSFTADDAPEIIIPEYDFMGWSTVRIPTRDEIETEGFIIDPGDRMITNKNVKLYANYTITVQGLVNENYAVLVSGNSFNTIEIKPECPYNILLVSDWQQVAMNIKQLRTGVDNTIVWNQYLPDEWYTWDLVNFYNNKTLPFKPGAELFWALGDQDYVSNFTIGFSGTTGTSCDYPWYSDDSWDGIFASANDEFYSQTPENLTVNINGTYSFDSSYMFTNMRNTTALTLNTQTFDCTYTSNMFAGCNSLRTLNINGNFKWDSIKGCNNMFKGDNQLTSIPYNTAYTRDSQYNTLYPMFNGTDGSANCGGLFDASGLTYIGPILNMNAISLSGCTIGGNQQDALDDMLFNCPNLTDVRIINLNNNDWNFSDKSTKTYIPKMNKDSIEYLVAHLTDCTSNPHTLTFSTNALTNYTMDGDYAVVSTSDPLYHVIADALAKGWTVNFMKKNYLKFTALQDCNFRFNGSTTANTLSYSLNDGETWTGIGSGSYVFVQSGSSILWKGTCTPNSVNGIGTFSTSNSNNRFSVEGNVISLLYGDNYANQTDLTGKDYAFSRLFYANTTGNTSIVNAENMLLPATILANYCYFQMFYNCCQLTKAPKLPATILADWCYSYMFYNCSSLTTAPSLPATTLTSNCYQYMFWGCSSLTTTPELPATTLVDYCYGSMFKGCTSLTTAPELPATTLEYNCYRSMFNGCTSLNYIKCLATNTGATQCTTDWVQGVAPTGTFVKDSSMTSWTIGINGIPTGWVTKDTDDEAFTPLTFVALESGTFRFSGSTTANTLSYSLDSGATWTALAHDTYTPTVQAGDSIMFKGNCTPVPATTLSQPMGIGNFISTGRFNVEGNVMYLISDNNPFNLTDKNYAFARLFYANTNLINAEDMLLPATTLVSYCYLRMFDGCTSLVSVPELPATTLSDVCYGAMFSGCTSLTTLPVLPATTLADNCYSGMFSNCTGITSVPSNYLPLTTLAVGCYESMFSNCTSLTSVPELPATTLAAECYGGMFYGCSSLVTVPSNLLPATTLAWGCYSGMFQGCTSLTSAPYLPAPILANYCYNTMFSNCSNLNYIKCLATSTGASQCTTGWVDGVASAGTFAKAEEMTSWTRDVNGIPTGWTVEDVS